MNKSSLLGAVCAFLFISSNANAAFITSMVGDKDCFGLGGTCSDGDHYAIDLGGSYFADNRSGGEVLGVDEWGTTTDLGGPSFTFGLDLGGATPTSASLEVFTAGIDLSPGATFFFNGSSIGTYVESSGQENRAATLNFTVPVGLLSNPDNLTLSLSSGGDGFIIDYVELKVATVPVPAAFWLFGSGLLGLVGMARRKQSV